MSWIAGPARTSGAEYPVAWRLSLPELDLALEGQAMMPNQELNVSTVYWEGAVAFRVPVPDNRLKRLAILK